MIAARTAWFLLVITLSAFHSSLLAAPPVEWNLKPQDVVHYRITQNQASEVGAASQKVRQVFDIDWVVESLDEQGAARIKANVVRVQIEQSMPGGQTHGYDSASDETPQGLIALMAPIFDVLVENGFHFTLSQSGEAADFQAPEGLSNVLKNMPGAGAVGNERALLSQMVQTCLLPQAKEELSEGTALQSRRDLNLPFAGKRVLVETYTYQGEQEADGAPCAAFSYSCNLEESEAPANGPFELELKVANSSGELLFDRKRGRLASADLKQTLDQLLKVQGQEVKGTLTQTTKVECFDERPQDEEQPKPQLGDESGDESE